jgi:hypothetical protein
MGLIWVFFLRARPNSKEPKLEIITNLLLTLEFSVSQKNKNKKWFQFWFWVWLLIFKF